MIVSYHIYCMVPMKFLKSTLIFTLISYAVQWVYDYTAPLPSSQNPDMPTAIDGLLNADPQALLNMSSLVDGASLQRMLKVAIITCLLMACWPAVLMVWRWLTQTIRWPGQSYFLSLQNTENNPLASTGKQAAIRLKSFTLRGRNVSGKLLSPTQAYLLSRKTGGTVPVQIDGSEITPRTVIPSKTDFLVVALLQDHKPVLTKQNFLKDFGPFTLVLISNGKTYRKDFKQKEITTLLKRVK
jgi:hypothetical protein